MQPYTHFTVSERENLRVLLEKGTSLRSIAQQLGRSPSSVSREIKRNGTQKGYNAWWSTSLYLYRRKRCRRKERYLHDAELLVFTQECLSKYWSPEIIVAKWKEIHPGAALSHNTIYRALLRGIVPGYTAQTHLRRRNLLKYKKGDNRPIKPDYTIVQRPVQANERQRIGDWEGDTVHGKSKGVLVTCVDRKSRYLVATIAKDRTADVTNRALIKLLGQNPFCTLTLDRGPEFARFRHIQEKLKINVYFANPGSPWQRGSNENVNGLLRFFFPKNTDFLQISSKDLNHVLELINTRPRKCLNWLSPHEVFFSKCCT